MGLRETLNKNQGLVVGVVVVLVLAAGWVVFRQMGGSGGPRMANASFYTDDNGATYFTDAIDKIPPFDHEGKEAVRAYVYECEGKPPFVGYVERYSPEAKPWIEKLRTEGKNLNPKDVPAVMAAQRSLQQKRPTDAEWTAVPPTGRAAINCDNGQAAKPVAP